MDILLHFSFTILTDNTWLNFFKNTRPIGTNVIPTLSFVCIQQLDVNKKKITIKSNQEVNKMLKLIL